MEKYPEYTEEMNAHWKKYRSAPTPGMKAEKLLDLIAGHDYDIPRDLAETAPSGKPQVLDTFSLLDCSVSMLILKLIFVLFKCRNINNKYRVNR